MVLFTVSKTIFTDWDSVKDAASPLLLINAMHLSKSTTMHHPDDEWEDGT